MKLTTKSRRFPNINTVESTPFFSNQFFETIATEFTRIKTKTVGKKHFLKDLLSIFLAGCFFDELINKRYNYQQRYDPREYGKRKSCPFISFYTNKYGKPKGDKYLCRQPGIS